VVLIRPKEEKVSCAEIVRRVKSKISLEDFKVKNVRFREASSGGILLEVLDPDATPDGVDAFAGAIGSALGGCVNVSRPVRRAEFRLRGFDPSVTGNEIRETVAKCGGCPVSAVSVSDIRRWNSGQRVAWVARQPLRGSCR